MAALAASADIPALAVTETGMVVVAVIGTAVTGQATGMVTVRGMAVTGSGEPAAAAGIIDHGGSEAGIQSSYSTGVGITGIPTVGVITQPTVMTRPAIIDRG